MAVFLGHVEENLRFDLEEGDYGERKRGYGCVPGAGELGERVEVEVVDVAEGES